MICSIRACKVINNTTWYYDQLNTMMTLCKHRLNLPRPCPFSPSLPFLSPLFWGRSRDILATTLSLIFKKLNYIHSYALQRSKIWINLRWRSPKYKKNPPRLIIFADDLSLHQCTVCSSGELKEAASPSQLDGDSTGHLQLIASQRKHLNWGRSDPE